MIKKYYTILRVIATLIGIFQIAVSFKLESNNPSTSCFAFLRRRVPHELRIEKTVCSEWTSFTIRQQERIVYNHINDYSDSTSCQIRGFYYNSDKLVIKVECNHVPSYLISDNDPVEGIVFIDLPPDILTPTSYKYIDAEKIIPNNHLSIYRWGIVFLLLILVLLIWMPRYGLICFAILYHLIAAALSVYYSLLILFAPFGSFKQEAPLLHQLFLCLLAVSFIAVIVLWFIWIINTFFGSNKEDKPYQCKCLHAKYGVIWPSLSILICVLFDLFA